MGVKIWNFEQVLDRRNNKHCLRLHMDIPLTLTESSRLQDLFNSRDNEGAVALLKKKVPEAAHKSLEEVFKHLKK